MVEDEVKGEGDEVTEEAAAPGEGVVEETTEAAPEGEVAPETTEEVVEEEVTEEVISGEEEELPEAQSLEEARDGKHKVSEGSPYADTPVAE